MRVIYEIPEPDPFGAPSVRPSARYRYAYPDGHRYNTEAPFSFDGHLVIVPKTTPAKLYRFDQPLSTGRVNHPRLVASLAGSATVSMAAVAPDRTTLVLANHGVLFSYHLASPARYLFQFAGRPAQGRLINMGDNVEAGSFLPAGRCKLLLVDKSRTVYASSRTRRERCRPGPQAAGRPDYRDGNSDGGAASRLTEFQQASGENVVPRGKHE